MPRSGLARVLGVLFVVGVLLSACAQSSNPASTTPNPAASAIAPVPVTATANTELASTTPLAPTTVPTIPSVASPTTPPATVPTATAPARVGAPGQLWLTAMRYVDPTNTYISSDQPILVGGTLFVNQGMQNLLAVDIATGRPRWDIKASESGLKDIGPLTSVGNVLYFTVAVASSNSIELWAVDDETGHRQWTVPLPWSGTGMAEQKGTLYVMTAKGTLFAIDDTNGQVRWQSATNVDNFSAGIYLDGDPNTVYVYAPGYLGAFDRATGASRWVRNGAIQVHAVTKDRFYALVLPTDANAPKSADIVAINAATGQDVWHLNVASTSPHLGEYHAGVPRGLVSDGTFYETLGNSLVAVNIETGSLLFRWDSGQNAFLEYPIRIGNRVIVQNFGSAIYALDASTHQPTWEYARTQRTVSYQVVDGQLYIFGGNTLDAVDPQNGKVLWSFGDTERPTGAPLVVDQTLYFTALNGVYALRWGLPQAPHSPWHIYAGDFQTRLGIRLIDGIAIESSGNLLVNDGVRSLMITVTPEGNALGTWGQQGTHPGQFSAAIEFALDDHDNVYVADRLNNWLERFSLTGQLMGRWGRPGTQPGQFNGPASVALDPQGNIYVGEAGATPRVQKFSHLGQPLAQWGGSGMFAACEALAVDRSGNIYVADMPNDRIVRIDHDGKTVTTWGKRGPGVGELSSPGGIVVNAAGNVFVADGENNRIQEFSPAGVPLAQWGTKGTELGQFQHPGALAIDQKGDIFVVDVGNNRVQWIDGTVAR